MNLREAAQQALEALEYVDGYNGWVDVSEEITALRAALAEPTSQESRQVDPVAYVTGYSKGYATVQPVDPCLLMPVGMALYRSLPKRKPMTEQQLDEMFDHAEIAIYFADRQRAEHLEVYSFGVRDAEKWHGIGGIKK